MVMNVMGIFSQTAHVAQILFTGEAVDHAARAEEEQRLEESVRHQVENAGGKSADAQAEKHVAELGDGGVREDLLDVVLDEADGSGEEGRERSDDCDHVHGERRMMKRNMSGPII